MLCSHGGGFLVCRLLRFAFALLVAFARNNGKYIVLAAAVFLLVVCRKEIREALVSLFVPLFATLLVIIVVQGPVYSRLGVDSSSTVEEPGRTGFNRLPA